MTFVIMTISNFEIKLDNSNKSYFAGHTVSGQVVVDVQERPKAIHGMELETTYMQFVNFHLFSPFITFVFIQLTCDF